jgi:lactate dehydrogenase-like 2-hydroxyacid dehydrogenase
MHVAMIHMEDENGCPAILLAGRIPHTPMEARLHQLQEKSKVRLYIPAQGNAEWNSIATTIRNVHPRAMLVRPAGFKADAAVISALNSLAQQKIVIGNLGAGKEHLAALEGHPNVEKIYHHDDETGLPKPNSDGNPISVAELTVFLAQCLRRPLHEAVTLGRDQANPENFHNQHEAFLSAKLLKGTHWLCLGAGRQVRALLPLLRAYGVKKVFVWNSNPKSSWTPTKFDNVTANIPSKTPSGKCEKESYVRIFDDEFEVVGVADFREAANAVDVVSIHIRSTKDDGSSFKADAEFLSLLRPTCHLINVARGFFVPDEQAVVDAVKSRRLGGFAGDVIAKTAEDDHDPASSRLWQMYQESRSGHSLLQMALPEWNIVLLPHLGGSTVEAFEDFDHVIALVLAHIGIPPAAQ